VPFANPYPSSVLRIFVTFHKIGKLSCEVPVDTPQTKIVLVKFKQWFQVLTPCDSWGALGMMDSTTKYQAKAA